MMADRSTKAIDDTLPYNVSRRAKKNAVTTAIFIMVTAMLVVPLMDVISKYLSSNRGVSPVTITWIRFFGQAGSLGLIILLRSGSGGLKGNFIALNLVRGMLVGAAVSSFFLAIKYLPLAEAIAIFFVEPLIVLQLSAIFLGEKVGWRRNLAALIGFSGALLIIQPTYKIFGATAFFPLATAVFFAIYLIISRKVSQRDGPMIMQFWSGIGATLTCSVFLMFGYMAGYEDISLTLPQGAITYLLLAILIAIATCSHLLIIIAFSRAEASVLAPFQYLEIVTMTIGGYFVFGDFPTPMRWLGIAIIISAGLYIFLRERKSQ